MLAERLEMARIVSLVAVRAPDQNVERAGGTGSEGEVELEGADEAGVGLEAHGVATGAFLHRTREEAEMAAAGEVFAGEVEAAEGGARTS